MKHFYKEPHKINELEKDLNRFNRLINKLYKKKDIVNEKKYLDAIAKDIVVLDRHAQEVSEIHHYKEVAKLIQYILHTPCGAPIVTDATLFDAATIYPDEISKKSTLHLIFNEFSKYLKKNRLPFFDTLALLSDEIKKQNPPSLKK
jgi:hypothetical protein